MAVVTLGKPMGLVLMDHDAYGVCVEALQEGGAAQQCNLVTVGDWLLTVDHTDVSSLDLDATMEIIEAAPGPIRLAFARHIAVTLPKPLGLELVDGEDGDALRGVHVENVRSGLAAEASGLVQHADIVQSVNGQDVSTMTVDSVLDIIHISPSPVSLNLVRMPSSGVADNVQRSAPVARIIRVELPKPLGLVLEDQDGDDGGVVVKALQPEGQAQMDGMVLGGDRLMAVNSLDVSSFDVDQVLEVIGNADDGGKVALKLERTLLA